MNYQHSLQAKNADQATLDDLGSRLGKIAYDFTHDDGLKIPVTAAVAGEASGSGIGSGSGPLKILDDPELPTEEWCRVCSYIWVPLVYTHTYIYIYVYINP